MSGNGKSHVRLSQVGCPCGRLPAALAASSRRPAGPVRARVRLQQGCSAMPRASLLASSESCYISRSRFASSVLAVGITAGLAQLRSVGRAVTGGGGARTRSGWPGGRVIAASCLKACLLWVGSIGDVSPVSYSNMHGYWFFNPVSHVFSLLGERLLALQPTRVL